MQIELRNVKYAAFASRETACFQATVYIDGKKAGEVSNEGHGGPDSFHPWELAKRIDEYAKTLPPHECSWVDKATGKKATLPMSAEIIIGDLLNDYLTERDLKRKLASTVVFTKKDDPKKSIYVLMKMDKARLASALADPMLTSKIKGCDKVLNLLPLPEAKALWKQAAAR